MAHQSDQIARWNKILGVTVAAMVLLSFLSYNASVRRAERFERGQKFLPNLNPDEIAEINAEKGDSAVQLRREGDRFVLASANGYPAANESVNRFLRDVLDLTLDKKVGAADDGLREKLGLVKGGAETTEVALTDAAGNEMVRFLVGAGIDGAGGQYVLRTDQDSAEVYLSAERVFLSTDNDSFIDKDIVDVAQDEVVAVRGADFVIAANEEGMVGLSDPPNGKKESAKVGETRGALSALRFTKEFVANDSAVASLRFETPIDLELSDQSGYRVEVARDGEKHYLRIKAYSTVERVEVAVDATEEEAQEKADVLLRLDEIRDFNTFHGSWIYEVPAYTADKFRVRKKDLVEDA